jgi:PAS domain S-box-containing protein
MAAIAGRVLGAHPGQRVVLFAHWGDWWVQPLVDQPFTLIQSDSSWRNSTHFGTEYAAVVVDGSYKPPARTERLPSIGSGVLAVAVVKGRAVFWQTAWFLLAATLASAMLVAAYFRLRMKRQAQEEERFREAIDAMPAMAFLARFDGYCTFVNRGWVEFTGLTVAETAGEGWQAAVHPHDVGRVLNKWRASLASGETFEHEMRVHRVPDGTYRWFLMRAVPLHDKQGKILKWCTVATDIEGGKQVEELQAKLAHVSRVNTMGELVSSISHELLQPITATTLNAKASLRWLERNPPELSKVRERTEKIIEASNLASEIINRLRSLYKKAPPKRELVGVNEVIDEMAAMLRSEAQRHGISIRTDLHDDLPMAVADRVQLQQVLMNLMLNSIEAMCDTGGVLTVRSRSGAHGKIQISVDDTGPGLPPDVAGQLFEAFFTTKPQGSGMGLWISKSIVEAHGGHIWVTAKEELGATFHFDLSADIEKPAHDEQGSR